VSLSDYLKDCESKVKDSFYFTQSLALRKMDSESSVQSIDELINVSESDSLHSSAEQSLMSGSVNAFFGVSEPSS
jgi:uncharacterized tellurite resistance protein B-like protein